MSPRDVRLGIDTATPYLALALWSPSDGLLARRAPRVEREHAARLLPELEALLEEGGVRRSDVRAVTAGVGPGSYTGVRVGIATARALAAAWRVPLGGASTLAQIAWGGLADGEAGAAVLDARRGNVYAALYRREGTRLAVLASPAKEAREVWRARFAALPRGSRWLEDVAPDAEWAARRPPGAEPPEALYL